MYYVNLINQQINDCILIDNKNYNNYTDFVKIVNPCEYIFSKVPGSKYSVSKLKPQSNFFYDLLEVINTLNIFELYENINVSSLCITTNVCDTIECFEIFREKQNDLNVTYDSFNNDTIEEINNLNKKL